MGRRKMNNQERSQTTLHAERISQRDKYDPRGAKMRENDTPRAQSDDIFQTTKSFFVAVGILPFLLAVAFLILGLIEPRFWSAENIFNVFRQSSYLSVVAMAQLLVLLTGNFDLSVGSNIALVSVVANLIAGDIILRSPDSTILAMTLGALGGLAAGTIVGVVNGIGVAYMKVHSFIMTLGTMSVALGVALLLSSGMPVSGMPRDFGQIFGYGRFLGIPAPVIATLSILVLLYVMLNWTRFGRHIYSIGSNIQASRLSGIDTQRHLFWAHTLCGIIVAFAAILLTARVGTGEAHMGNQFALSS
ncbi:ABC transporter permease, partial [Pseudorhodoplanes sp.]|uniref:ABC transporter permease n=1 Tax=Pseudorhodoplanes sp. TaxID=1934341 RepID=UPI003D0E8E48